MRTFFICIWIDKLDFINEGSCNVLHKVKGKNSCKLTSRQMDRYTDRQTYIQWRWKLSTYHTNLSDIALATLLSDPFRSVIVNLLSRLTLDLIDDFALDKRSLYRWVYVCILVRFNLHFSIQQYKFHFEKWQMKLQQHTNIQAWFTKFIACHL